MGVTAVSAALSSFTGLRSLAEATGWPPPLAPLLPLTVDAYAMTATRVWLARSTTSPRVRYFARWNAVGAVGLSLSGNAIWHLLAAHVIAMNWTLIVAVGAVPPAVLGLLSHLAVLRTHTDAVPQNRPVPRPSKQDEPRRTPARTRRTEAELLVLARTADEKHRQRHGRPITRDALRRELRISAARATELARRLKQEPTATEVTADVVNSTPVLSLPTDNARAKMAADKEFTQDG
jgi:hypothetical protein